MTSQIPGHGEEMVDKSIEFGRMLANPKPGEEVVITGLSGQYPNSKDVYEFRDNLINKVDMVSDDTRRWEPGHPEIPQRTGKLPDISKFDAGFFGIHHRQANSADPMLRILLETVISAILDAGLNPSELEGSNTGVFVGSCFSESEKCWFLDKLIPQGFALTGCQRSMLANRVSYFLKLKGPSFICDTACSSSLYALEYAYKTIRMGKCDQAIVAGTNLCLHPFVSLQFARLGVLSMDGTCKVFDKLGNGYTRSEAISAILLQKAKQSKRIYCTILHAKTNCDGYKNSGITYPSGEMQVKLLKEFYRECTSVRPADLSFLEAHGTGTKVGDPEELQAIEEIFLPGRSTPLLIGSVKSNIGHSEPTSGLCSITKVILAMESGFITPNIHFNQPRSESKALQDGRLKVVTENTPFNDDRGLIGINSFGFGGGNCHILLKHHPKVKPNHSKSKDGVTRLVCVSGRTKKAVEVLLDDVIANKVDVEHVGLLHQIFKINIPGHLYRGYILASKTGEITRLCSFTASKTPHLVLCFGPVSDKLKHSVGTLINLPVVLQTIDKLQKCLTTKGPTVLDVLTKPNETLMEKILSNFFLHVVLADLIKACDIVPDKVVGLNYQLSLGLLVAAYWDDVVSLKEAVDCAISIAWAANIAQNTHGIECEDISVIFSKTDSIASQLQQNLRCILNRPKRFSKKVVVTSSELSSDSFISSFSSLKVVIEHLQASLSRNDAILEVGVGNVISLIQQAPSKLWTNNTGSTINDFFKSLGWLYEKGFSPQLHNIYPTVEFPVSRGTPMISPKVIWKHHKDWWVTLYKCDDQLDLEEASVKVMLNDPGYSFLSGHVIDGRILFPATGYLQLVWQTLANVHGLMIVDTKVVLENCKFIRACSVQENHKLELAVMIQRGSGQFEVVESGMPVVTGIIRLEPKEEMAPFPLPTGVPNHVAPILNSKDVYKELKLRGYNYKDDFRCIQSYDSSVQVGQITWNGNWITFIDNMLQLKILESDTRLLYVPVGIDRLYIDPKKHMHLAKSLKEERPELPVYLYKTSGIVRCGGIEIRGLKASSIPRRKYLAVPVLEKHVFVPNRAKLTLEQATRVNSQIVLENIQSIHVKAVELIDESTQEECLPLGQSLYQAFADQPLIQPEITILSKKPLKFNNVKVEDKKLFTEVDCDLVVASQLLQRPNILSTALIATKINGFILSRESLDFDLNSFSNDQLVVVTTFFIDQEQLVFLRKKSELHTPILVKVSAKDFDWLPKLQEALNQDVCVIAYAQGEPLSGLLGLVACVRREPGGHNTKLVFLPDSSPEFDIFHPFYKEQLSKNLAVNILKNGQWGTYRHLLLENNGDNLLEHCYMNSVVPGDLSSLRWLEGPLSWNDKLQPGRVLVSVYYASLNFKDLMIASGRIRVDTINRDRREQECLLGLEFSGITQCGKRVFGIVTKGACATLLNVEAESIVEIPDFITLEEAATIPVVYCTSYLALFKRGKLKAGESVLVHSGTGGVGQAAITLALHAGCTVYTTVGTKEKREFLKKRFPQLTDSHIASSRNTYFEGVIMSQTGGRGVDVVLNSLAEEKLIASVRCLAHGGRFMEIGKFDLANNNRLQGLLLSKGASFHGVMLDDLFQYNSHVKLEVLNLLRQGMQSGAVRPLNRTVFAMNQAEEAFRYMSTGQHTGKVLIQTRQEEFKPTVSLFPALPKYSCDSDKVYIICGGLGGFGLELADWLVLRGCRKLVLTSRTGLRTGYQAYRTAIWKSYGCELDITTKDITTYQGCVELLSAASRLGPVHAIFNLAVILKDGLLTNQSAETFKKSFEPKAIATRFLDKASRLLCLQLRDFVVFSSVSCGRGNAGQSNYGMSNSVMERICEKRRSDGLPGLAIQWGAIGDVGLVAELQNDTCERAIGGTLLQRISNCFQVLDVLLRQNESAVVSSMVVAEKRQSASGLDNVVEAVAHILGVKDLKAISLQATLAEVGMDSMTAVEIKQTLEREYDVFLTGSDIKTMTFAKLMEIQAERDQNADDNQGVRKTERALRGMDVILRNMGNEATANLPELPITRLENLKCPTVVLFPGVEGVITVMEPLYKNLKANLVGLQYPNDTQKESIREMAAFYLPLIKNKLKQSKTFNMVCYSFGGVVALEVAALLEEKGYLGKIICIDSAPDYLKSLTKMLEVESDDKFQVSLLVHLMSMQVSYEVISKHVESLLKLPTLEDRIKLAQKIVGNKTNYSAEHQRSVAISLYKRLKAVVEWEPNMKLRSKIVLFKPYLPSMELSEEDYGLSRFCCDPVEVRAFEGNHVSVLANPDLAEAVNGYFSVQESGSKGNKLLIEIEKIPEEVVYTKL